MSHLLSEPTFFELKSFEDLRGTFLKIVSPQISENLSFQWKEFFMTESEKGVIRGFHFQRGPKAFNKIVSCVSGKALDVLLDLRIDSSSYGQTKCFELDSGRPQALYIPAGFAHAFQSLESKTKMLYCTDQIYDAKLESGFSYKSFPKLWPLDNVMVSEKDNNWPLFKN